ncbi:MAG: hypothetical protein ACYCU7_14720 [Acidimicrobiales bacterium]
MSTPLAATAATAALAAAGLLPTLAVVGARPVAVLMAPLAGAVVAAAAGACSLGFGGGLVAWFCGLAAVAAAGAAAAVGPPGRRRRRRSSATPGDGGGRPSVVRAAGLLVVVGAAAVGLVALRAPSTGFDARTIWLLHGVWFADGHSVALAALRNPALTFAHASYPPLVGASVGLSWLVTGEHSYRLGVVVIAVLNACAVTSAASVAIEAALAGRPAGGRRRLAAAGGVVVAGALVLAAFGVAGPFATNGYADLLWASAAVGAVGYGLVLPLERRHVAAACLLLAVAGLTKDEGIATAMAIVLLVALRLGRGGRCRRVEGVTVGLAGVAVLGAWPVLVRLLGAAPDQATIGRRQGSDLSRAGAAVSAMVPHLHVLLLAAGVAVVGALVLGGPRRRLAIGNDGWAWGALGAGAAAVVAAYAAGGGNVEFWLATSVHRTTFFPALAGWWIVGTWAVVALASAGADAPGAARQRLDAADGGVLHHRA